MEKLIEEVIAEIRANPHKYPSAARKMSARLVRVEAELQAWKDFAGKTCAPCKPIVSRSTTTGAVDILVVCAEALVESSREVANRLTAATIECVGQKAIEA